MNKALDVFANPYTIYVLFTYDRETTLFLKCQSETSDTSSFIVLFSIKRFPKNFYIPLAYLSFPSFMPLGTRVLLGSPYLAGLSVLKFCLYSFLPS